MTCRTVARISLFDFDVLREAFRNSVLDLRIAEAGWEDHARMLVETLADEEPEDDLIPRIIGR